MSQYARAKSFIKPLSECKNGIAWIKAANHVPRAFRHLVVPQVLIKTRFFETKRDDSESMKAVISSLWISEIISDAWYINLVLMMNYIFILVMHVEAFPWHQLHRRRRPIGVSGFCANRPFLFVSHYLRTKFQAFSRRLRKNAFSRPCLADSTVLFRSLFWEEIQIETSSE